MNQKKLAFWGAVAGALFVFVGITGSVVHAVISAVIGRLLGEHAIPAHVEPMNAAPQFGVPAWGNGQTIYLDPGNVSTCASDTNSCVSSTCGAAGSHIGPCVHWFQLLRNWGGYQPFFKANTTVQFMSTQPDGSDPVVLYPILNGPTGGNTGVTFRITATLTAQTTSTLAGVVAKVRTTNTSLQVNESASADGFPALLQNTTSSPTSYAWSPGAAATPGIVTQPMSTTFAPTTSSNPAEDNGWANGNAFVQYSPLVQVDIVDVRPVPTLCIQTELCHVVIDSLMIDIPGNPTLGNIGDDRVFVNQYVWGTNLESERDWTLRYEGTGSGAVKTGCTNCLFLGGFNGGQSFPSGRNATAPTSYILAGGALSATNFGGTIQTCEFNGVMLDDDMMIDSSACRFSGYNYVGALQLLSNPTVRLGYGVFDIKTFNVYGSGTNILWGQGILDAGQGSVLYKSGAGAAAATFPTTSIVLRINNGSVACLGIPSVALPTLSCNKTINVGNMDTDLGTVIGAYWVEGGGSIGNLAI